MNRYCIKCNSKLPENAKFCHKCGTQYKEPTIPMIDFNTLAFADEEEQQVAQAKYAEEMKEYILSELKHEKKSNRYKKIIYFKSNKKLILILTGIILAVTATICITKSYTPYATINNGVYVTTNGTKYHKSDCKTITASTTLKKITLEQAQQSYQPCKVCKP